MSTAFARKKLVTLHQRLERIRDIVHYMDMVEGRGWCRRMGRSGVGVDQECPNLWLTGMRCPGTKAMERFEAYAVSFGFVGGDSYAQPGSAAIHAAEALKSLETPSNDDVPLN